MSTRYLHLFILILAISLNTIAFALEKKREYVEVTLLKVGETEERLIEMEVVVNSNNEYLHPRNFDGTMKFRDLNGVFELEEKNVDILIVTQPNGERRIFMSESKLNFYRPEENLVEVLHLGKISWFTDFNPSKSNSKFIAGGLVGGLAGALIVGSTGTSAYTNWLKSSNDPQQKTNLNNKSALLIRMKDRPDLHDKIQKIETNSDLLKVLQDYDTDPEVVAERMRQNSPKVRSNTLKILNSIDSVKTRKVSNIRELKEGDFIKYVGPGDDKYGVVKKIISSKAVQMEYNLDSDPKVFTVRVSDIELIIE